MNNIRRLPPSRLVMYVAYGMLAVLLCYGFSPLIKFYSTDSSVFYSIGNAMTQGTVVYRDIFDHKGLWVYFFNFVGAELDHLLNGWGMYIVESAFCIVTVVAADRIFSLFLKNNYVCIIMSCLFLGLSLNYFTYMGGNFTETYALTLQMISCALIAEFWFSDRKWDVHPPVYMFVHGICSGVCLFLRMNLVAMWVPFGIALAILLIKEKNIKNLLINFFALVCGVATAAAPVIIYGAANGCMEDMIFCMFTYNMGYVGEGESAALFIKELLTQGATFVLALGIAGAVATVFSKKVQRSFKLMFCMGLIFVMYATFMGMRAYGHYYQTLLPFVLPVFVLLGELIEKHIKARKTIPVFLTALVICFALTLVGNMRSVIRFCPIDTEYKQLKQTVENAEEYISSDADKSLLTTSNFMQAYVITGIVPDMKYPYIPGAELPDAEEDLYENILSGKYKYIFGCGYSDGYWMIYSGEEQKAVNDFISENYIPISVSEEYAYVMFMRNDGEYK